MVAMKRKASTAMVEANWAPAVPPEWVNRVVERKKGFDVRFVGEKVLTASDLDLQQHRFLVPRDFVRTNLIPALVHESERRDAGMLDHRCLHAAAKAPHGRFKKQKIDLNLNAEETCKSDWPSGASADSTGNTLAIVPFVPIQPEAVRVGPTAGPLLLGLQESRGKKGGKKKAAPVIVAGIPVILYTKAGWWFGPMTLKKWESSGATITNGKEWELFSKISGFQLGKMVQLWSFRSRDTPTSFNIVIGEVGNEDWGFADS